MKLAKLLNPKSKELIVKLMQIEVPVKTAIKLKTISDLLTEALTVYEKNRIDIVFKHADKNEDGTVIADENNNAIFSSEEARISFAKELAILASNDIVFEKIKLEELGADFKISAADFNDLQDLIAFE